MERNVQQIMDSEELRTGARELVQRQVEHARVLLGYLPAETSIARGGRKAATAAECEASERAPSAAVASGDAEGRRVKVLLTIKT